MRLIRLAIWPVIALLSIGIAALLYKGESTDAVKNAITPEQAAAAPQVSEKERLLRNIIDANVEREEYVHARLDLASEEYLKAYHDNIMDIANAHGGTITDNNVQQNAIASSQYKATAVIGGGLYHTTPAYDDLTRISELLKRRDLAPDHGGRSHYAYYMARQSEESIKAFRDSLEKTAIDTKQGNYGTIEPKNVSQAIETAQDAMIKAGEKQAAEHSGWDYLPPGETTKFANEAFNKDNGVYTPNTATVPGWPQG